MQLARLVVARRISYGEQRVFPVQRTSSTMLAASSHDRAAVGEFNLIAAAHRLTNQRKNARARI